MSDDGYARADVIRVGPDDDSPRAYPSSPYSAAAEAALVRLRIDGAPDPTVDPHYRPVTPDEEAALIASAGPASWQEPEDRGTASLSDLGEVEYVADLIRPGRIVTWAAEEGSGKSFTVIGELAIRLAVAGGSLAGTWAVQRTGPVLVLSEMHSDDDYLREATILASLGLDRPALSGRYFRLPLMTAAGGAPVLTVAAWREWIIGWLRDRDALLLVFDTATGAWQGDPWGPAVQGVFRDLRLMLDAYPALAVVLIVHVKKPNGRGARGLSAVLGEWGRWCDVVVMQENDGASLDRAKLTVRKRVRHERRIVATKAGGLLVDPVDADTPRATKVARPDVLAAIPPDGITLADLAAVLGVSKDTAGRYADGLEADGAVVTRAGQRRSRIVYRMASVDPTAAPPHDAARARFGGDAAVQSGEGDDHRRIAARTPHRRTH